MNNNIANAKLFIATGLFLLSIIVVLWLIQFLYWITIQLKNKKQPKKNQYYQELLKDYQYDCQVKKVKFIFNFLNYRNKINHLKLTHNDYQEKTNWNLYRNLIHILLIKWKKEKKLTSLWLILVIISFYLSITLIVSCALVYFINLANTNLNNINTQVLAIFSFISFISLILTWVMWTMIFEKIRKQIIVLAKPLEPKTFKVIQRISYYKTLFPGSELLL